MYRTVTFKVQAAAAAARGIMDMECGCGPAEMTEVSYRGCWDPGGRKGNSLSVSRRPGEISHEVNPTSE